jgi:hypothetical protein
MHFMNGLYKGQFTEQEASAIPEHLRWRVLFRTGAARLIGISGLPHEPMIEVLSRGKRGVPVGLLSRVRPDALTALEWSIGGGRSVYYGKDWEQINNVRHYKNAPPGLKAMVGFPDEPTSVPIYKKGQKVGMRDVYLSKNPTLFYLLSRVPGSRAMKEYMALATDSFMSAAMDRGDPTAVATTGEHMGAFLLGQKPTSIDFESSQAVRAWRLEQRLMEHLDLHSPSSVFQINRIGKSLGLSSPDDEDVDEDLDLDL